MRYAVLCGGGFVVFVVFVSVDDLALADRHDLRHDDSPTLSLCVIDMQRKMQIDLRCVTFISYRRE